MSLSISYSAWRILNLQGTHCENLKYRHFEIQFVSHFFVLFFIRVIFKLYICIPTNCTQLIYFINNTLKHMYCLKL